ncbi:putative clathrin assembly protein At4g40080 [Syzygium oleosum]|uniref:putative clathrin assembly protein At4g40080 n=1 Tax=Syzygium oleosum TaxID=219896 RepID=UPI0024BB669A|nr:putative clathrin assembly protein At4g40080 [Syzygium oleosum]
MAQKRKLRVLMSILRDKVSILKATLSLARPSSSSSASAAVRLSVLRATAASASPGAPPPEDRLAAVLLLGRGSRVTARSCVAALMDRLHGAADAAVALKCLVALHRVITQGTFILRDQLSFFPGSGGRNYLNLSRFRDGSDPEAWELSSWARWYAEFLEQTLIASRRVGFYLCGSPRRGSTGDRDEKVSASSNPELLIELDALLSVLERVVEAPDQSGRLRANDLVHEVVRLVGEDYGATRSEISLRLAGLGERLDGLSSAELAQLAGLLTRLGGCKDGLMSLFGNRKNNDGLWDSAAELKAKASAEEERREGWRLVKKETKADAAELARLIGRFTESRKLYAVPSAAAAGGSGAGFRGLDLVPVTVSAVG